MNLYTILQKLCACPSVSGREESIRGLLREMIAPFVDEVSEDNLGNLIAHKNGSASNASRVECFARDALCAYG